MFLLSTATTEEDQRRIKNIISQPPTPVIVTRPNGDQRAHRTSPWRRAITLKDAERMAHDADEYDNSIARGRRG